MPSIESKPAKAQPWKAHWSPASKSPSAPKAKAERIVDKSGALLIDGDSGGWSWPSAPKAKAEHIVDESGALLIDGDSGGWSWLELLGAQKEEKDAK